MARPSQPVLDRTQRFCRALYLRLNAGNWGSIDPDLFQEVADEPIGDLSTDALQLRDAVAFALEQVRGS